MGPRAVGRTEEGDTGAGDGCQRGGGITRAGDRGGVPAAPGRSDQHEVANGHRAPIVGQAGGLELLLACRRVGDGGVDIALLQHVEQGRAGSGLRLEAQAGVRREAAAHRIGKARLHQGPLETDTQGGVHRPALLCGGRMPGAGLAESEQQCKATLGDIVGS